MNPSSRKTFRGQIQSVRRKNPPAKTKIFMKRNEYLNYSTRHIRELEESVEHFDVIRKSYSDPEFPVQMEGSLRESFVVFQSSFQEFEQIIQFQKTLDREIRANIDKAIETLNVLNTHSCEMKFRCKKSIKFSYIEFPYIYNSSCNPKAVLTPVWSTTAKRYQDFLT